MRGPQRAPLGVSAERYRLYGHSAHNRWGVWLVGHLGADPVGVGASAQIRWGVCVWLVGHLGADPVGVGASAQIRWGVWMWLLWVVRWRRSMAAFCDDAMRGRESGSRGIFRSAAPNVFPRSERKPLARSEHRRRPRGAPPTRHRERPGGVIRTRRFLVRAARSNEFDSPGDFGT